ncbi:PAS domain-containing protein [Sorangium sp. So ce233]|uniref:PAS domain-containing protein n=1 Tax=Sorangium sp. So ce233 TaxID=3133290 RepID=UPI003F6487B3
MAEDDTPRDALQRDNETLRAQNEQLRRELAELRQALARREPDTSSLPGSPQRAACPDADGELRREHAMRRAVDLLRAVVEAAPMMFFVKDTEGRYILANGYFLRWTGLTWDQVAGKTDHELFPRDRADVFLASDSETLTTGRTIEWEESAVLPDGQLRHFALLKFPIRDASGELQGICGISTDISSSRRAEEENRLLQAEIIRAQEMSLRALSTPLMPIAKGVIVMPLIGNVDQRRAQRVLETLLTGIVTHEAGKVILDITGVPVVDTEVANALLKTAQAVKLLGATVILTGIQPKIAQTLVDLGADLSSIITRATLESGIAHVLDR